MVAGSRPLHRSRPPRIFQDRNPPRRPPRIHHWIRLALAWSEMLACVVFLIPRTMKAGATLLIMVLALAAFAHALHGNFQIEGLLIFAAAVGVVSSQGVPK